VKLSVKSDYAARAVLALARHFPDGPTQRVEDLAVEQGVSANYLVQILIELKAENIVKSVRGKEGGYRLARAPAEITLGDIIRAVHGHVFDSSGLTDPRCPTQLRRAWNRLREAMETTADAIHFQALKEQQAGQDGMYFI